MPIELVPQSKENRKQERSKELIEFLNIIDFSSLHQIFSEYTRGAGLILDDTNFVGPENIEDSKHSTATSYFDPGPPPRIGLNMEKVKKLSRLTFKSFNVQALEALCHEEGHGISKHTVRKNNRTYEDKSGYSIILKNRNEQPIRLFSMFDEGVTEKMGREVARKYAETHPDFANKYSKISYESAYQGPVDFVHAFIRRLSREIGFSEDTVWQAIIRSKVEGFDFFEKEIREMFGDMFGEQFLDNLARTSNIKDIRELTNFLENSPLMKDIGWREKIRRKFHDSLSSVYRKIL
jgi:hypothetical protein